MNKIKHNTHVYDITINNWVCWSSLAQHLKGILKMTFNLFANTFGINGKIMVIKYMTQGFK